jgi:hypothetical protein
MKNSSTNNFDTNVKKKIFLYDSNLSMNVSNIMSNISSTSSNLNPSSILFSNRMRKYKEEHGIFFKNLYLEDNIEWEIPAFVIITDDSILGHRRVYSSIEKKLKMDSQDNVVYNMLSQTQMPPSPPTFSKREFSIVYEPCDVTINSISVRYNRLSYAKIGDYCSMNYPKSVKKAYKHLIILWLKHIEEYPEYWDGFDTGYIKQLYNDRLDNANDFEDEYIYNIYNTL